MSATPMNQNKVLKLSGSDLEAISNYVNQNPALLLQITQVRIMLAISRLSKFQADQIKKFDHGNNKAIIENAVEHNLNGLIGNSAMGRPDILVNLLKSIDYTREQASELRVLSVGPRSEVEIFSLLSAGFNSQNVFGLDLLSYSPFVDLGDMHQMPYRDNEFDVLLYGWVIAYSHNPKLAAKEAIRVAKPGAIILVGCEYNPLTNEELSKTGGILTEQTPRFYNTKEIEVLFGDHIGHIYARHDIREDRKHLTGSLLLAFEVKK